MDQDEFWVLSLKSGCEENSICPAQPEVGLWRERSKTGMNSNSWKFPTRVIQIVNVRVFAISSARWFFPLPMRCFEEVTVSTFLRSWNFCFIGWRVDGKKKMLVLPNTGESSSPTGDPPLSLAFLLLLNVRPWASHILSRHQFPHVDNNLDL
jgi:hypothetical protein